LSGGRVRRNITRTRAALLISIAGLAMSFAASAAAGVMFSASMSPETIHFPRTKVVEYRLTITTGPQDERFAVWLARPSWGKGFPVGSPLGRGPLPVLRGPGTILRHSGSCSQGTSTPCRRGFRNNCINSVELSIPANSTTTLVARYRTGRVAPWSGTDFRLRFLITESADRLAPKRFRTTVLPHEPDVVGKTGVRIGLELMPKRPAASARLVAHGHVRSTLVGQRIRLVYHFAPPLAPDAPHPVDSGPVYPSWSRPLGEVRIGRRGLFQKTVASRAREGVYTVWAYYEPQRSHLMRERSCPMRVDVGWDYPPR